MAPDRYRPIAVWMIVLALAALLWSAPVGLSHFPATSWPTQTYYSVLVVCGISLLAGGAWLLLARRVTRGVILTVGVAAVLLAVNQVIGLAFNTILCFSAG